MKHRIPLILSAAAALLLIAAGCSRKPEPPEPSESFRVYRKETGTVEDIPLRDYLIGTVGAEMPASFAPEALKA